MAEQQGNGGQGAVVGIDLGTTLSVIAHLDASGHAATIPNRDGEPLTPSAIYLDGKHAIVGRAAKEAASHNPDKVATYIKRSMGEALYARMIDGRQFRPETLSAIILRKLKQDAERRIGPISRAVITVPAFFDDTRRQATADAGRIAGLDVLDIINEPTAAAIAYSLGARLEPGGVLPFTNGPVSTLVYDLGGGTFDCTVVRLDAKSFETIATDGEVQLGGKDWDDCIIDYIGRQFSEQHGVNPALDAQGGREWRESVANLAESTKKLLSQLASAPVECFHQGRLLRATLTRDEFEDLTRDLLTRTQVVTKYVVRDQAKVDWGDLDRVLLVGGSTRMPAVQEMLTQVTGRAPDDRLDPDQVVAHGAVLAAAVRLVQGDGGPADANSPAPQFHERLRRELKDVVVRDVNSHSLGIQTLDKRTQRAMSAVLVPKNTPLPHAASRVFRLNKAGVRRVTVKVLEGEAPEADANIQIGECRVSGLPELPERAPIQVRLAYTPSGRVEVMALDMTGGTFAQAEIKRQAGLTESDIERERAFVANLKIQ